MTILEILTEETESIPTAAAEALLWGDPFLRYPPIACATCRANILNPERLVSVDRACKLSELERSRCFESKLRE